MNFPRLFKKNVNNTSILFSFIKENAITYAQIANINVFLD